MATYPAPGQPGYGPPMATAAVRYGGFWRRFFALIVDAIIIYIPVLLLATSLGIGEVDTGDGSFSVNLGGEGILLNLAVSVLYDTILLTLLNGRTIGKLLFGMHVVGANGRRISFGQALGRSLMKQVSFAALGLGCLWVAFDRNKQGWHDKVANTFVVR
jgi:uncharacterized RDD family membrane protein YckC